MKKPTVKLTGRDGNAFVILGACRKAAKDAKWTTEQIEEATSGDYDNLLLVAYFEVK